MKKTLLLCTALASCGLISAQQAVSVDQYEQMKSAGQLNPQTNYIFVTPDRQLHDNSNARHSNPVQAQSSTCNCLIPLDTTFNVVPFTGGLPPDYRNDDGFTNVIQLPFTFNFYGTNYDSIFINNNGNISFGTPYSTFTANPFPDPNYSMIAPFWADVDTRDSVSGLVYYKITPTHMIVKWENVGYYNMHNDKLNTFQLIMTDGQDTILPPGSNVAFCYGDMQWTTGDASSGLNGFGGTPSTVGCNKGNGVDYFQVTQNDSSGNTFDGPYGSADGVDWLDNQEIYFNTSLVGNIPPLVMNSTICDTIDVYTGDTLRSMNIDSIAFDMMFMTPEPNQQLVSTSITSSAPSALTYTQASNSATYQSYSCVFHARNLPPGLYTVTGTATDNGTPAGTNTGTVYIRTYYDISLDGIQENSAAGAISIYPNPADDQLTVETPGMNNATLVITDISGRVVYTGAATGNKTSIDVSSFGAGVYFVSVCSADGEKQALKFVRK
ncbi:MAG TPA: nidogen-like domain-containing protein [Bacteroidia bacterium]|nr:nidogen-like domain-containing protein [Bacteroidia bacterium]